MKSLLNERTEGDVQAKKKQEELEVRLREDQRNRFDERKELIEEVSRMIKEEGQRRKEDHSALLQKINQVPNV